MEDCEYMYIFVFIFIKCFRIAKNEKLKEKNIFFHNKIERKKNSNNFFLEIFLEKMECVYLETTATPNK